MVTSDKVGMYRLPILRLEKGEAIVSKEIEGTVKNVLKKIYKR